MGEEKRREKGSFTLGEERDLGLLESRRQEKKEFGLLAPILGMGKGGKEVSRVSPEKGGGEKYPAIAEKERTRQRRKQ